MLHTHLYNKCFCEYTTHLRPLRLTRSLTLIDYPSLSENIINFDLQLSASSFMNFFSKTVFSHQYKVTNGTSNKRN